MKTKLFLSLVLLLGALGCAESEDAKSVSRFRDADVVEFARLAADTNHLILDVRTPGEFAAGHLVGAVNLDWRAADFGEKAAKLDKNKTYLVHCASGRRSVSACNKLGEMGFTNLVNLKPGIKGWEAAGKPVVR